MAIPRIVGFLYDHPTSVYRMQKSLSVPNLQSNNRCFPPTVHLSCSISSASFNGLLDKDKVNTCELLVLEKETRLFHIQWIRFLMAAPPRATRRKLMFVKQWGYPTNSVLSHCIYRRSSHISWANFVQLDFVLRSSINLSIVIFRTHFLIGKQTLNKSLYETLFFSDTKSSLVYVFIFVFTVYAIFVPGRIHCHSFGYYGFFRSIL